MFFTVLMDTIKKIIKIVIGNKIKNKNCIKCNFRIAIHNPDDIYIYIYFVYYRLYVKMYHVIYLFSMCIISNMTSSISFRLF